MLGLENFEGLETKKQRAVVALTSSRNVREAADRAGVHETTLYRWLREDEAFERAYDEARNEAMKHLVGRLQRAAGSAVDTLEEVCQDPSAPATARVAASREILALAFRTDRLSEIEALLNELQKDD